MAVITDLKARSIQPKDTPISHGGVPGLQLRPAGKKGHGFWVYRYTSPVTKARRSLGLGGYPEVSIAEVGREAANLRAAIKDGIDPLLERERIQQEAAVAAEAADAIPTFQKAAELLHQELLPSWKNAKHGDQWINTLKDYVFPVIGNRKLNDILPRHIADTLRPIWLDKPETASRVKQRMHAVIAWGWAHGYCSANPVDVVGHLLPPQPSKVIRKQHHPAMPWKKIPEFVTLLRSGQRAEVTRTLLEFVILTACRSGEARGMTWDEVDFANAIWSIPAERMKAKMPHRIPLTPRMIEILKGQRGEHETLVFPSVRDRVMLSDMALAMVIRRLKANSDTPGRIATVHGFRSSFRDWCSEHGYARDLAERALAHTIQNQVEAAYHRTDLLEQRRRLMIDWENFVVGKNNGCGNVLSELNMSFVKPVFG